MPNDWKYRPHHQNYRPGFFVSARRGNESQTASSELFWAICSLQDGNPRSYELSWAVFCFKQGQEAESSRCSDMIRELSPCPCLYKFLGWHLCRTNLPQKCLSPKRETKRKVKQKIRKTPRNVPEKCWGPVQPPKTCSPPLFHSFAPAISNTSSNTISHFSQRESAGMAALVNIDWIAGRGTEV